MLSIKVLGSGCAKCNRVEQRAAAALESFLQDHPAVEATIEHIMDQDKIIEYPIMVTPALVVNELVVCSGRVPSQDEVIGWLQDTLKSHTDGD
jgi:small redox-active disulfide protein 2